MNTNETIIHNFYTAFANADIEKIGACYHTNVVFRDPVFGELQGEQVCLMWKMLIEKSKRNLKIKFSDVLVTANQGSSVWIAEYRFSKTNRKVTNTISSKFQFQEGLISNHIDDFDLWKWSKQAMGIKGILWGWTGYLQQKIQEQARNSLKKYSEKTLEI